MSIVKKNSNNDNTEAINMYSDNSKSKADKIVLQNLLFGTSEKKLMVSDKFLNDMALKYISRRMRVINFCNENMHNTKIPTAFFKYANDIEKSLDELIIIEPYYSFKNPVPSVFKKGFIEQKSKNMTAMISHSWKYLMQKNPIKETISNEQMEQYDKLINELLSFRSELSESDLSLIDEFYITVHGVGMDELLSEHEQDSEATNTDEVTEQEVVENN